VLWQLRELERLAHLQMRAHTIDLARQGGRGRDRRSRIRVDDEVAGLGEVGGVLHQPSVDALLEAGELLSDERVEFVVAHVRSGRRTEGLDVFSQNVEL